MNREELKELLLEIISPLLPKEKTAKIEKAVNEMERKALFVVLEPDTVDLHEDIYSAVEVEKAMKSFNTHCMRANLFHRVETQDAEIIQSYTTPVDMYIGDREIKKGTWLQEWYFPKDNAVSDKLWEKVLSGEINGVSIGAIGKEEILE